MRVRSSSAPTVRRRPNQRALSMASAAGSTNPARRSMSREVKWCASPCSIDSEADDRPAGGQHGVEAGGRARGRAGAAAGEQVLLADQAAQPQRPGQGRREVVRGDHARRAGALPPQGVPPQVGVVDHQQGDGVEVEELAELAHRRVEHLVEVERGRQRLGDLVQLVEQRVGVGQATQAVERQDLSSVGLAGDAAGVAGDERDEQDLHRPLHGRAQVVLVEGGLERPREADRDDRDDGDAQAEAEPAGEPRRPRRR